MDFEDFSLDEPRDSNKSTQPSSASAEKKKVEVSPQEALATTVSRIVLGLILLVSFAVGCWVAASALHHPDACWFLALGRWIYEHGAVPDLDPFSWTMTVDGVTGHPFVVDQWLSALISYLSTLSGGLLTLLMLNAVVVVTAFLSLPLGFVVRRGAPFVPGLCLVLLAMVTAFLCPTSCTQIFSYLFIAVFLQVVHHARSAMLWHDDKVFRIAYVLVPLMVLWANMHVGFVVGLMILTVCLLGTQLSKLFLLARPSQQLGRALTAELSIALVGCLLATLATPYGWSLWVSMPDSWNSLLAAAAFAHSNLLASGLFGFLCFAFVVLLLREIRASKNKRNTSGQLVTDALVVSEIVTAALVGFVTITVTVVAPRLIVFTSLIVLAEILALLGLRRLAAHADAALSAPQALAAAKPDVLDAPDASDVSEVSNLSDASNASNAPTVISEPAKQRTFWQDLNFHSLDVWLAGGAFELAIVSFCSIAGVCLVANKIHKPELPASEHFEQVSLNRLFANPSLGPNYKSAPSLPKYLPTNAAATTPASTPATTPATIAKALLFIEENKAMLGDRLFNDATFGSFIDWQLRASPKVFIDTRFSGYERRIVDDYHAICDCSPRCQQLLDGYAIDSVFVQSNSQLAQALSKLPGWKTVYRDDSAVILVRNKSAAE